MMRALGSTSAQLGNAVEQRPDAGQERCRGSYEAGCFVRRQGGEFSQAAGLKRTTSVCRHPRGVQMLGPLRGS